MITKRKELWIIIMAQFLLDVNKKNIIFIEMGARRIRRAALALESVKDGVLIDIRKLLGRHDKMI